MSFDGGSGGAMLAGLLARSGAALDGRFIGVSGLSCTGVGVGAGVDDAEEPAWPPKNSDTDVLIVVMLVATVAAPAITAAAKTIQF